VSSGAQPVRLALSPSPGLAAVVLALHGAAAIGILTAMKGGFAVAAAMLILMLGAAAARDRALLKGRNAPKGIEIRPSGEAFLLFHDGSAGAIQQGAGGVNRYWVGLHLKSGWKRAFLVTAGMVSVESFRLLRLWALWGKLPGVALRQLSGRS
jgi:hypothetical protein